MWLATPVTLARAPIDPAAKLECVSYAPFRGSQTPFNPKLIVSPEQIEEDLVELAKVTQCVRTYSVDNGLDKVPELASKVGLKVLLGIWIGNNRTKNALLIDTAVSLAKDYPDAVKAIIVGNEVMLHGDMTPGDLRETIRSVKARVSVPVSYADVWEYWLRYRELSDVVDFVTVHILPYWENSPVRAEDAAAHVVAIAKQVAVAFPGKEVLIGETGWPSNGRMRDGAIPSRTNQARVVSEILDLAKREHFHVNLIEAYDASWKREWEGTVGGNWGLFDGTSRQLKYPPGVAISNYPLWKRQMASGMALAIAVFAAALLTLRRKPWTPRLASWVAVGISATTAGILLGVAADKMFYESYGVGGWLRWGSLLAAAIASPLFCANALMSGRALPTFLRTDRPARRQNVVAADDGSGIRADRDHVDRGENRACSRVRSTLARLSIRQPDHGGRCRFGHWRYSTVRNRARVPWPRPCSRPCSPRSRSMPPSMKAPRTGKPCGPPLPISCWARRSGRRAASRLLPQHRPVQQSLRRLPGASARKEAALDPIGMF